MGQPDDFSAMVTSVIDAPAFNKIKKYIDEVCDQPIYCVGICLLDINQGNLCFYQARNSTTCTIIAGGKCDDSVGYFIEPTIIVTTDPNSPTIVNELFGPVLTIFVYPENQVDQALELCDTVLL